MSGSVELIEMGCYSRNRNLDNSANTPLFAARRWDPKAINKQQSNKRKGKNETKRQDSYQ